MHDRRQPGREPTVVVDDPTEASRSIEELVEDMRLDDLTTEGLVSPDTAQRCGDCEGVTCPEATPTDEPESVFAKRAKLIALLVATAALVTSAVVATSIAGDEQDNGSPPGHERGISGAAALGGFVVSSSDRSPSTSTQPDAAPGSTAAPQAMLAAHSESVEDAPARSSAGTGAAPTAPSPASPHPDDADGGGKPRADSPDTTERPTDPVLAVREFYALVASSPETALTRVAPEVLGADRQRLLEAWQSMTSVSVEYAAVQEPGTARVVVIMSRPDGSPLRITQLLSFGDGAQPTIDRATLLSIQTL